MKFPLSWLKEIIATTQSPEQIARHLTLIGIEVEDLSFTKDDALFEVAITPNLIHAASIVGIARELASLTGEPVVLPSLRVHETEGKIIDVVIKESTLCPSYKARLLYDVKVQNSPLWLVERLEASGIRSVNNVVDVTNLVMCELGHPLHAFDYDQIEGHQIIVRHAYPNEKITTLDGKEHCLSEEILVIADQKKPMALAGVLGGVSAEISQKTKIVVLEAAYFSPTKVRTMAKHLGIHTESSYRFERGTDPNVLERALDRAVTLLHDMKAITSVSKIVGISVKQFPSKTISCRLSRINRVLGTQLVLGEVESIFKRCQFKIESISSETMTVTVPTYRNDLHLEIDLIEEIARFYGYENIFQKKQKVVYQGSSLQHHPLYAFSKKARFHLLSENMQELLTCNLISPEEAAWVTPSIFPSRSLIHILNPTSKAHCVMRPSLLPGLCQVVKENINHRIRNICGFEIGKIHFKFKEMIKEPIAIGIILTGECAPFHWGTKSRSVDFYDLKGILETFFSLLYIDVSFQASQGENFHPGRQAKISLEKNHEIGIMGELHPHFLDSAGIKQPVLYAELNLEDLFSAQQKKKMVPLPLFPASSRDWTCTLSRKFLVGTLLELIESMKSLLLEEVLVLDVYQSEELGSDQKNVTLRFQYRDENKTISFEEVEEEHERIIKNVYDKVKT